MVRAHSGRSLDALISDFILGPPLENIESIHEQSRGAYDWEESEGGGGREGQLNEKEQQLPPLRVVVVIAPAASVGIC